MDKISAALYWHSLGIATVPLAYRTKRPLIKWKGYQHILPSVKTLESWLNGSQSNLALIATNNLVVLDFDNPTEYAYWFSVMSDSEITDTYTVLTSRGFHLYYWIEEEFEPINSSAYTVEALNRIIKGQSLRGLKTSKVCIPYEIKSHGRLITIPPSVHQSGAPYRAINSPDKIKKVSSINDILTFSPVKFERPKLKSTYDPWRIQQPTNGSTERVNLLDLFPDAKQTDDKGQYWICDCPVHGNRGNFMLNIVDGVGYCHAGCGSFLATELEKMMK